MTYTADRRNPPPVFESAEEKFTDQEREDLAIIVPISLTLDHWAWITSALRVAALANVKRMPAEATHLVSIKTEIERQIADALGPES